MFQYYVFLYFQRTKRFVTDIKIRHLINTHVLFRNVAVSVGKQIIFKQV